MVETKVGGGESPCGVNGLRSYHDFFDAQRIVMVTVNRPRRVVLRWPRDQGWASMTSH